MQALETNIAPVHSLRSFYKQALTYRAMADLLNKETFASRPLRVSIEGNVGCGKSTLIKYFKNFDEIDAKSEPLDEWRNVQGHNLLHLLYADQKRWNFTFQLYVQLSRLNLQTTQSDKKIQLFERSLQNSRHCFVV
ncbi:deoxynucleoside kinase isoform X1 [Nilaparvata lugens]|uniref:deoxynucleoside kinase isoform X1 n=2 Tax=Nilaparvata lugens TaxID=108931 RepID=UPI00193CB5F1|nr:deoxynucleoside kinase isoform X1 [Nilaparvata lugens]